MKLMYNVCLLFFVLVSQAQSRDEDEIDTKEELREAFRLYDKEGNGYIKTSDFREIMRELDDTLTEYELDEIIAVIDTDVSETVDFEEFMQMMTGD